MTDEDFMKQALVQARQAYDEDEVPIGAVVVINDKIIARGFNQVEKLNDPTAMQRSLRSLQPSIISGVSTCPMLLFLLLLNPASCAQALFTGVRSEGLCMALQTKKMVT